MTEEKCILAVADDAILRACTKALFDKHSIRCVPYSKLLIELDQRIPDLLVFMSFRGRGQEAKAGLDFVHARSSGVNVVIFTALTCQDVKELGFALHEVTVVQKPEIDELRKTVETLLEGSQVIRVQKPELRSPFDDPTQVFEDLWRRRDE